MHFQCIQEGECFIFSQIVDVVPNTFQNFCECYNIQVKPYATPMLICSLRQEIHNGQKVLLTVVTQLLNPTLKCIDNFRLRQLSIPSAIYMFKVSKKQQSNILNTFKVNNKYTRTASDASFVNFEHLSHIILLLILLNLNK